MSLSKQRRKEIKEFILWNIRDHPSDIVRVTQKKFNVSRPAVLRYIHTFKEEGQIKIHGLTSNINYSLLPRQKYENIYQLKNGFAEDKIWRTDIFPLLNGVKENVLNICQYGFTEIFNNALDHSEGTEIEIKVVIWVDRIELNIADNGIGIFNKIQKEYNLDDALHAILELSKGKLTTEPENHTGEGIFFSSRMFDFFAIVSGKLGFGYKNRLDMLMETEDDTRGTAVRMEISTNSKTTMSSIFSKFSTEEFGFDKTIVPVRLARYGNENLVSRSQAKRLLARLDRFKNVILDFNDVVEIGRAFADEIFRVFANAHPGTKVIPMNENREIKQLIEETERENKQNQSS